MENGINTFNILTGILQETDLQEGLGVDGWTMLE